MSTYSLYEFKDGSFGVRVKLLGIFPTGFISMYSNTEFSDNYAVNAFCKGSKESCLNIINLFQSY